MCFLTAGTPSTLQMFYALDSVIFPVPGCWCVCHLGVALCELGVFFSSSLSCLEVIIKILRIHCNLFHESERNCCDEEFMWSEIVYL